MVPQEVGFQSTSEGQSRSDGSVILLASPVRYQSQNYLTEYCDDKEIRLALVLYDYDNAYTARLLVLHHGRTPKEYNDSSCAPIQIGLTYQNYDRAILHVVEQQSEFTKLAQTITPHETDWVVLARRRSPAQLEQVHILPPRLRSSTFPDRLPRTPISVVNCQRLPSTREKLLRMLGPLGYIIAVPLDILTFPIWIWGVAPVG